MFTPKIGNTYKVTKKIALQYNNALLGWSFVDTGDLLVIVDLYKVTSSLNSIVDEVVFLHSSGLFRDKVLDDFYWENHLILIPDCN